MTEQSSHLPNETTEAETPQPPRGDLDGGAAVLNVASDEALQPTSQDKDLMASQSNGDLPKAVVDVTVEPPSEQLHQMDKEDFSVFTVPQIRAIILTGSFAAWFSPMSGSIYYPALNEIASDLNVTSSKVNITVTVYLIIQGVAPMMIAGFADKAGRRPAYFICFVIYIIANLGLALQNNYVALLVLRMLQAAGSSGTVALANGLVGDLVVSSDRGKYIAFASLGGILGPTLSPIIGGLISQYLDWHWIFWFLLILSCAFCIPFALFLPETCRKIVGDGSVPPPWTSDNLTDRVRFKNREKKGIPVDEKKKAELRKNYRITIPNPIATLVVLSDFESALIMFATGLGVACFYAISTGASVAFRSVYGFNELQISLIFVPIGAGSIVSAFTTGKMVDWNYRRHAKRLNFPVKRNRQTDLSNFPVEMARLQIGVPLLLMGATAVVGYGWMMDHHVSLAGPVIILFILGYTLIAGFQCLNVLMVDIYPGQPATATAANNVTRCLLGAAASAAIGPLANAVGNGWAYTILAGFFYLASIGPLMSMKYGMQWRKAKKEKLELKRLAKEAKVKALENKAEEAKGDTRASRSPEALETVAVPLKEER
ncbi:Hypothetical protein R9X50_00339900 [Acrodontium crateriforme]|uniref:Major facilitator superfamily (MFS) profile domain-containing protein n=1 Tax=Acrodontium crateriforme TaxID=150365 RepID=A0AAQ3R7E6_9PEZI|nr:Hypothetical protein R9X50_00339900 [Acrodontium crateriforme]